MKKLLLVFWLMTLSMPVMAHSNAIRSSIKDISTALASINQEIVNAYQKEQNGEQTISDVRVQHLGSESIQINLPVTAFQNALPTLKHQAKVKSPLPKSVSKKQAEDMYEMIIVKMYALKKKYENNPYIKISGFDINIGIVPSVTVSIEFKK